MMTSLALAPVRAAGLAGGEHTREGEFREPPPANRSARAGTPRRTPPRSAGKGKSASPAAKMQAHALVSLANLREEMEDKERVWGDALAEAEAELAGAKREASEARTELAEEKAKTPEKLRALAEDMLQARETTGISFGETRDADARRRDADTQNIRVSPDTSVSATSPEESVSVSPGGDAESLSVFARAKNASLDREVRRLTERLAAAEARTRARWTWRRGRRRRAWTPPRRKPRRRLRARRTCGRRCTSCGRASRALATTRKGAKKQPSRAVSRRTPQCRKAIRLRPSLNPRSSRRCVRSWSRRAGRTGGGARGGGGGVARRGGGGRRAVPPRVGRAGGVFGGDH